MTLKKEKTDYANYLNGLCIFTDHSNGLSDISEGYDAKERFIQTTNNKDFSKDMSLEDFEKAFLKGTDKNFNAKLPKHKPRHEYLKTLLKFKEYLTQEIDKKKKDACKLIDIEYRESMYFYKNQIKKYDSIIFLEGECNFECLPKQDS